MLGEDKNWLGNKMCGAKLGSVTAKGKQKTAYKKRTEKGNNKD